MCAFVRRTTLLVHILFSILYVSSCHAFGIFQSSSQSTSSFKKHYKKHLNPLHATWSNGQAVQEYKDFLSSGRSEVERLSDRSSVIVANPEIEYPLVDAILSMGLRSEKKDVVVRYDDLTLPNEVDGQTSFPIYIAIPPWQLASFLDNLPPGWMERCDDFVYFSGGLCGVIEPVLRKRGMARDATTQVDVHGFTMPGKGQAPQDLSANFGLDAQGEDKYTGETGACGKWCGAIAERLENNFIRCRTGFYREWRRWMWEMAAYDVVFNLVGSVRGEPTNHKQVALYYDEEASDMLWQIANNLRGYLAVTLPYGFEERVYEYAERNGEDMPCHLSTAWYEFTIEPFENSQMVCEYVTYAQQERGWLPDMQLKDSVSRFVLKESKQRQGNLRSDGVI